MKSLPLPIRVAAGIAVTAVEQARTLPAKLAGLPVTVASQALQVSMRVQQQVTELAIRGDEVLAGLRPVEETPEWATFDEDIEDDDDRYDFSRPSPFDRVDDELDQRNGHHPPDPWVQEERALAEETEARGELADEAELGEGRVLGDDVEGRAGLLGNAEVFRARGEEAGGGRVVGGEPREGPVGETEQSEAGGERVLGDEIDVREGPAAAAEALDGRARTQDRAGLAAETEALDGRARAQGFASVREAEDRGGRSLPEAIAYDELSLPQLRARLRQFSEDELAELLDYERANSNRPAFTGMLTRRISTVRDQR